MTSEHGAPDRRRKAMLTTAGVVATLTVFVVDALIPHDYDVSYLYVVTVLVAGFSGSSKVVIRTAIGSWALTISAFLVKEHDHPQAATNSELFSRSVACLVIALVAVVAILVIRREQQNSELGNALRVSEGSREADKRMLAAASAVATIGTWSIDADDDRFDWSDAASEIHGWEPGMRPTRTDVLRMMPEENAARVKEAMRMLWESALPFREETPIRRVDGTERWIVIMGEAVSDPTGPITRVHGTVQDITPWKEAELSASSLTRHFAQMTQSLPIIVFTTNDKGEVDYVNEALSRYTGAPADAFYADQWLASVDPRDVERVASAWLDAVAAGVSYDTEYRIRGADGIYRWHHISAEPEYDESGAVVRWWGSTINVDAAHMLKERADELASEREMILETMVEGVAALDREWRFTYLNPASEVLLGRSSEELVGKVVWDEFPPIVGTELEKAYRHSMSTGTPTVVTDHHPIPDKWFDVTISPNEAGITVFVRETSQVRKLSDQLAQSQRLESVGQLTGGIAHDFNNLLTVVWGGADALLSDPTVEGEAKEMASLIASAAERATELTHRLLAFARKQPLEPRTVDINTRVRALEPLLRRTLGEHIEMVVAESATPAVADVDPGQFENALLNLAINASDAMPDGGTLTVEVASAVLDADYVTAHAHVTPGHYVLVTVTDSGKGIPPEHLKQLFDPFFTTKGMGKGSGLGLAMVWGFIKQSGGNITVYSEEGHGTSFKMYLPAAADAAVTPGVETVPERIGPQVGTILLAEDDDLVRRFATDRLRAHGYTVIEAASGPAALEALAALPHVDLLFTDVIMPGGITGRQLADAVLERRPGTPVLFASGYTENVILHNGRLDADVRLVTKPYSTRQLIDRVRETLAEATAGAS